MRLVILDTNTTKSQPHAHDCTRNNEFTGQDFEAESEGGSATQEALVSLSRLVSLFLSVPATKSQLGRFACRMLVCVDRGRVSGKG